MREPAIQVGPFARELQEQITAGRFEMRENLSLVQMLVQHEGIHNMWRLEWVIRMPQNAYEQSWAIMNHP